MDVALPNGRAQNNLLSAPDKNVAELSTMLLADTISKIGDMPLLGPAQVLDLPVRDRRKISEEIIRRNPGPQLQDGGVACPDCGTKLEVPLSMAALFQF